MALSDFFADTTSGNWADDMEALPTAPAPRDPSLPRRGEPGYLDSMPDRSARPNFQGGPPREELPIPTSPPYTAFIGNLTFETEEQELKEFFVDLDPISVRLVKDATGKSKGFGYVEFPSGDKLKAALDRGMSQLGGRTIRVSVAEPPTRKEGYAPSAADEANQWRRATPLPARDNASSTTRGFSGGGESREGREPREQRDLDWGAARGTRFVPAPPTPSGLRREHSGQGRERDMGPSAADDANQWRSARPMAPSRPSGGVGRELPPHQQGMGSEQSSPRLADSEQTEWSRGTKLRTPASDTPPSANLKSPGEERDWGAVRATPVVSAAGSRQGSVDGESPAAPAASLERRRLNLAPRSVPATPSTASQADSPSSTSSIFGSAKPIDSAAREREAAQKMAARDEERKKAREAEIARQKEEAEAGRRFTEEKARSIKEAQQKADNEALGKPAPAPRAPSQSQSNGPRPPRQQQQSSATNGHARRASNDTNTNIKSPRSPRSTEIKPEDGFEAVSKGGKRQDRGRGGGAEVSSKEKEKKENNTRQGFSFAAAAAALGEEEDEGKADVEEIENGAKEVSI